MGQREHGGIGAVVVEANHPAVAAGAYEGRPPPHMPMSHRPLPHSGKLRRWRGLVGGTEVELGACGGLL